MPLARQSEIAELQAREEEQELERARREREQQERAQALQAQKESESKVQAEQQPPADGKVQPNEPKPKKEKKEKLPKETVKPKRSLPGLPTSVKLELVEEDEAQTPPRAAAAGKAPAEEPARDPRKRPEKVDDDEDSRVQVLVDPYLETGPESTLSVEVLSPPVAKAMAKQPVVKRRSRPAPKKAIVKAPPPAPPLPTIQSSEIAVPQTPAPMLSELERDRKLQEIKQMLEQQTSQLTPKAPPPPLSPAPQSTPLTPLTPSTPLAPSTPMTPATPMTPTTPLNVAAGALPKDSETVQYACEFHTCVPRHAAHVRMTPSGV